MPYVRYTGAMHIKKFLIPILLPFCLLPSFSYAQTKGTPREIFFPARIVSITAEESKQVLNVDIRQSTVTVHPTRGVFTGSTIVITDDDRFGAHGETPLEPGEMVTIRASCLGEGLDDCQYSIDDRYRLPSLGWFAIFFVALVIGLGRRRGVTALAGLVVSIVVLLFFIVPKLAHGANPLLITVSGGFIIAVASMMTAHGFSRHTGLALISTLATLALSSVIAQLFTSLANLGGLGSENAFYLTASGNTSFNLSGLFLGGVIIGMLGVLDDVTTTQTATVAELHEANPALSRHELYRRGLVVGREHIASLVNTLVLAYAGTALPLFLLISLNTLDPLWVLLNSEYMAEEVVRTLAGSSALVLAVPISTALAARFVRRKVARP